MIQPTHYIEPLDAWRRALDVVIASAPVGHETLVAQQLQDALRSYQQQGPIQRVTMGERKACNQLTYLAVGQLILCAPKPAIDVQGFPRNAKVIGEQRFHDGGYVHTPVARPARPASAGQLLQQQMERRASSLTTENCPVALVHHCASQPAQPAAATPAPMPGSAPLPVTTDLHSSDTSPVN
ncbi:MAG: hypothetical protein CVV07_01175 [Gammaproteobacteria bacterium HGW-Gammaproteobacteria-11]|nr:MAG: hypothetical protein CVV07_01175 [Gammaproteobacteria bacterium HGW-Gammaproteobacteria-11]